MNFGPLLYHFEDDVAAPSLELSYTELRDVICSTGFVMEVGQLGFKFRPLTILYS